MSRETVEYRLGQLTIFDDVGKSGKFFSEGLISLNKFLGELLRGCSLEPHFKFGEVALSHDLS